jgi:probable HAF family extracellular repeat protein
VQCLPFGTDERCFERSVATDLNKAGTIVGFSTTATNIRGHAFVSDGEALEDLGALGGSASWAYGINDSGQIVGGFSNVGDSYLAPFLYDRGTMYDLNQLVINPSDARAMPFTAYGINNFGQILGNHHVLHPVYDQVEPGVDFQFDARLRRTLTFAYWVSRGAGGECRARRSRLYLEVKFQRIGGRHDEWTPADVVRACEDATDWQDVSIPIPRRARGDRGVVHVRVREVGPRTDPTVYLRHFSME